MHLYVHTHRLIITQYPGVLLYGVLVLGASTNKKITQVLVQVKVCMYYVQPLVHFIQTYRQHHKKTSRCCVIYFTYIYILTTNTHTLIKVTAIINNNEAASEQKKNE